MRSEITALALLTIPISATAQDYMDPSKFALSLGSILGSETACKLKFDPDAVRAYIAAKSDPSDLTMPNALSMMTQGTAYQIESMTETQVVAHCQLIQQTANDIGILR